MSSSDTSWIGNECLSNDFVLTQGGKNPELLSSDIHDWNIIGVCDHRAHLTSASASGRSVQKHLQGEEMFLANYTDGSRTCHCPRRVVESLKDREYRLLRSVKLRPAFHLIDMEPVMGRGKHRAHREIRGADERRVWCCGRRSSVTCAMARNCGRTVPAADRRRPIDGWPTRMTAIGPLHGYLQGKAGPLKTSSAGAARPGRCGIIFTKSRNDSVQPEWRGRVLPGSRTATISRSAAGHSAAG